MKTKDWSQIKPSWYIAILFAVLMFIKITYDYLNGNLDGLVYWTLIIVVSAIYAAHFAALLFPSQSRWLVGKKLYWHPFLAKNPRQAKKHLKKIKQAFK